MPANATRRPGRRLILLGDSILDNGAYVRPGEPDVAAQLRLRLAPARWTVELRAKDGSGASDVAAQVDREPVARPCCFVLSVGGNDALARMDLLYDGRQVTFAEALQALHDIRESFRLDYARALDRVLGLSEPLITCTIYNPRYPEPELQRACEAAVSIFNDAIHEESQRRRLRVIELRHVCTEDAHYANPIEPSAAGGERIAAAIAAAVAESPMGSRHRSARRFSG